jgi:hypothetical protein
MKHFAETLALGIKGKCDDLCGPNPGCRVLDCRHRREVRTHEERRANEVTSSSN